MDAGAAPWTLGDHHDGGLRDDTRAACARTLGRTASHRLLRGVGSRGAGAQRTRLRAHRPAAARDRRAPAHRRLAQVPPVCRRRVCGGHRRPFRLGDAVLLGAALACAAAREHGAAAASTPLRHRRRRFLERYARHRHARHGARATGRDSERGLPFPRPDRAMCLQRRADHARVAGSDAASQKHSR